MEDHFDTDIEDMWSAVTEPQRLARWVATVEGDLCPGGAFRARFTSGREGAGRAEECKPPRRLLLRMESGAEETVIEAQLVSDGDGTRLAVEERGIPLDELAAHGAGWQAHVEDLGALLAGRPTSTWQERWTELAPGYRERARNRP